MAYISYSELTSRYPAMVDLGSESTVNSAWIYFGEVELNARLASKFSVPFSDAYPVVKDLSIDITYSKYLAQRDHEAFKSFQEYIDGRIERLLDGTDNIYTDSGTVIYGETRSGVSIWSSTEDYVPTHSMLGAENIYTGIDSNYLYDLENERK